MLLIEACFRLTRFIHETRTCSSWLKTLSPTSPLDISVFSFLFFSFLKTLMFIRVDVVRVSFNFMHLHQHRSMLPVVLFAGCTDVRFNASTVSVLLRRPSCHRGCALGSIRTRERHGGREVARLSIVTNGKLQARNSRHVHWHKQPAA